MKTLRFKKDLFVDAGNITIADFEFYKSRGGSTPENSESLGFVVPLKSGRYEIKLKIPSTWNDPVSETFIVDVGSEGLAIGDAGYFFGDTWSEFLRETDFLNVFPNEKGFSAGTGGDGVFAVTVAIKKAIG